MAKIKRPVLKLEKRKLTGRKVKRLREQGFLPASVYGPKIESINVKGKLSDFEDIFEKVGETGLVDLNLEDVKENYVVLFKNPQYHPITDQLIHLDLYQVDLSQKVSVAVPVEITGEAPAAESGEGILVQSLNEIEIEALPTDLPEKFVVDVSSLSKIDDAITIADLKIDSDKIDVQLDPEQVVARIEEPKEEEEEEVAPVETEVIGEGPAAEEEEKEAEPESEEAPEVEKEEEKEQAAKE